MFVKLGFKNFYLYSAVNPFSGEHFTLEMPKVNADCLSVYLEELSKAYPDQELLIVMDGAGWHKAKKLKVPKNIQLVYLPPYSPELNPVERFWQHIKRYTIRNKIYKTLADLEQAVDCFLNSMTADLVKSICTACYLFD